MKNKLLILASSLLTLCILTTFDGLTQYPLNDLQMRTTARLKLEYIHLDSMNMTLTEALVQCDSVEDAQMNIIVQLDDLLGIKEDKIINLKLQNQMGLEMYDMVGHKIKREKKLKWIFVGTTTLVAGFLALSLL